LSDDVANVLRQRRIVGTGSVPCRTIRGPWLTFVMIGTRVGGWASSL
jgi:hypothetical protein